jgi:hypothetical protein
METMMQKQRVLRLGALVVGALFFNALPSGAQDAVRERVDIVAGSTVHVSEAVPDIAHYEPEAAGDPVHPGRLINCTTLWRPEYNGFIKQNCYSSFDDGKTWTPSLQLSDFGDQDPAVTYGLNDDVYVASLIFKKPRDADIQPPDPNAPPNHNDAAVVYKSTDGGHTFKLASEFGFIDRETIVVDTSRSKYRGRVYFAGQGSVHTIDGSPGPSSIDVWHSNDGGATFLGPVVAAYPDGSDIFGVGSSVVLSDGTYVVMYGLSKPGNNQSENLTHTPNAELRVITSRDGGRTLDDSHKIADVILDRPRSEGGILTWLAADPGSRYFKDRLYAVFPEIVDQRIQIGFSYSADKGKTWSSPILVNDDRSPMTQDKGPDHLLPTVAVNKAGVVLVAWYDRRNVKDNLGWQIRVAASLDGGQTFSSSIPISNNVDKAMSRPWDVRGNASTDRDDSVISMGFSVPDFYVAAGHTTGIAVDSGGRFFPTWIDNTTGIPQVWTAGIDVRGTVTKNGAPQLADLQDVSKYVTLETQHPTFNRAMGTFTVQVDMMNTSAHTIRGPIELRVMNMTSGLGVPSVVDASNAESGTGAIWDFSSTIPPGGLRSLQRSRMKTLTFRVAGLRQIGQGRDFNSSFFAVTGRIYAHVVNEKRTGRHASS